MVYDSVMWKLFRLARIRWWKIVLLLVLITAQILGTLYLPTLTADIINEGVVAGDLDRVREIGILMILVAAGTGVASITGTYVSAWVSTTFAMRVRKKLFRHTQKLSYQDFRKVNTSSLITRATNDIEQLQTMLSSFFEMMLPAPFVIVVGMVLAVRRDASMALLILGVAVALLLVFILVARAVLPLFAKVQLKLDAMNAVVGQFISGVRVVRAYGRTKKERERMDATFSDSARLNIRINRMFAAVMPFVVLVMSGAMVMILWFGGHRIQTGEMQIGDIMAITEYTMNILMYVLMAVFVSISIPRAKVCAERINEVLSMDPEIMDGEGKSGGELRLEFDDVDFRYMDAEHAALHDLSFVCEKGTTTAIIGGTGSGKSSIARLIPRLVDASEGEVFLGGVNVKELKQSEVRRRVGYVPQKAFLFSGTVLENLKHGNPKATLEEVREAARIAQADGFIMEMEGGYDAEVSQGGKNFSGGQRQRLAIARMLVKKPEVIVFDDSFSALDFKTDAQLRKALKKVTKESIVINVAQRISTIKDADQILVLDDGRIVGVGTHEDLLRSNEVYLEIAKSQLSEKELEI